MKASFSLLFFKLDNQLTEELNNQLIAALDNQFIIARDFADLVVSSAKSILFRVSSDSENVRQSVFRGDDLT